MIELVTEPGKDPTKNIVEDRKRDAAADDGRVSSNATPRVYARFDPNVALPSNVGWEAQERKRASERARRSRQIEAAEGDHPWSGALGSAALHLFLRLLPWAVLVGLFAWKMPRLFHWL